MQKRKIWINVMAIFLAVAMLIPIIISIVQTTVGAVTLDEIEALEAEASQIASKKEELQAQIDSFSEEQSNLLYKKMLIDENLELTKQEISNLTEQIIYLEQDIEQKQKEYDNAAYNEKQQMDRLEARVRSMEKYGTTSYLEILFSSSSFSDLLTRFDVIAAIVESDQEIAADLREAKEQVADAQAQLELSRNSTVTVREDMRIKQEELEVQTAEAANMLAEIENNIEAITLVYEENDRLEAKLTAEIEELIDQYNRENNNITSTGTYIWPSNSSVYVTSLFGTRWHPILQYWRSHNGVDIGADYYTDVLASDSGVVVTSTYDESYGNYVMISHGNDRYTLYAHMDSRNVSEGDTVSQGDVIGYVGSTGMSTGPHIHFEIWENGVRVDPLQYFSNYVDVS